MTRTPRRSPAQKTPDTRVSMYDERAATPEGRASLAAAEAALKVQALIERAFSNSSLSSREIATVLGVSEGRVSQLRHGDGNVRVSTLARLMFAVGLELSLSAEPPRAGLHWRHDEHERDVETSWVQYFFSASGIHECSYSGPSWPTVVTPIGEPVERTRRRDNAWIRHVREVAPRTRSSRLSTHAGAQP